VITVRRPTAEEAAALTVRDLLQRVREHLYFSLERPATERPATEAELVAGEAAWREWFDIPMPPVYRDLLAASNGVNYNGLFLFAALEHTVVEDGRERWLPGLDSENSGYLWGIAEEETRRFFGSADDDLLAYDTATRRWVVVDRTNWSGEPFEEFGTLEALLIDRMFLYLDEGRDLVQDRA
jgi:hypothetical protein